MHYERAPRLRRSKPDVAPPPLRCAEASLRCGGAGKGWYVGRETCRRLYGKSSPCGLRVVNGSF
jgi:hypothetical protein